MILPVLDGLDEIGPSHHTRALTAISSAAGTGGRFVLTSRTKAYERAVHDSSPLARTPVVELQPMTPEDAARYLVDGTDQPARRWDPVLAQLAAGSGTPLARTLSTPLMIWLARVVYQHRDSDPGELITAGWAGSRAGIEKHLLQELVPAAYTAAVGGRPGRTAAEARRAQRYLTTLARHLRADRTYDLAWWRLNEISPGPVAQAMTVILHGAATIIALVMALAGIVVMSASDAFSPDPGPLLRGLIGGFTVGIAIGLVRRLFAGQSYPRRLRLTQSPVSWLLVGLPIGVLGVLAGEPVASAASVLTAGICTSLVAGGTHVGGNDHRALSPAALLADDRTSATVAAAVSLLFAAMISIAVGFPSGEIVLDIAVVAFLWFLLPVAAVSLSAWGQFCVARVVLSACGKTPLRLMSFLHEAHDRGVLRQAGGVYQFRHNLLQDHLAAAPATAPADRAAP